MSRALRPAGRPEGTRSKRIVYLSDAEAAVFEALAREVGVSFSEAARLASLALAREYLAHSALRGWLTARGADLS